MAMSRSEKHEKKSLLNKIMVVGISLLSIISLAFTIYVLNGLLSTKELLTSKPKTIHTEQTEKPNHYSNELEKESKLKEEMKKVAAKEESNQDEKEQLYKDYETYQNAAKEEESYSYTYTVDSVENSEIYASSMEQGQVYFTQDLVKDNVQLNVGDTIICTFSSNEMDSITSVELVFSVNDIQDNKTEAEIQNDKAFEELEKNTEKLKKEVEKNYNDVMNNDNSSYNVKEVTIESIDGGEYTASNGVTFTSDQIYNGIEFNEGDNATVIYDEDGNLFEVNDGIMSEDGSYVSSDFYN
ncbi:hypothetical protein ACDN41_12515 [Priestia aryabhattai]|uniref:hypothetical protein n=1 Tax=Priestia aryabhattai TaxID=412384 RepID=UPI003532107E